MVSHTSLLSYVKDVLKKHRKTHRLMFPGGSSVSQSPSDLRVLLLSAVVPAELASGGPLKLLPV